MGPLADSMVAVMTPLTGNATATVDHDAVRLLAAPFLAAPYGGELLREKLDAALAGDESLQLTLTVKDGEPVALAMVEHIAGGHTWRVHLMCGGDDHCLDVLERALALTWSHGGRLAVAELPDDAVFAPLARQLRSGGFTDAGRVDDFFADGVPLIILARPIVADDKAAVLA